MRILIACEFSGVVREAFRRRGHDAVSCDLLPTEIDGPHIQGDVMQRLKDGWDAMIGFPPCTRLCNSGVRWLRERNLWHEMREAAQFFRSLLDAPIARVAIENPIMHGHAREIVGRPHDQIVQPWQFGHGETKATCLWLRGFAPLRPTRIVGGREGRVWKESPGVDRWRRRSVTYQGIADAMAEQWGGTETHE